MKKNISLFGIDLIAIIALIIMVLLILYMFNFDKINCIISDGKYNEYYGTCCPNYCSEKHTGTWMTQECSICYIS